MILKRPTVSVLLESPRHRRLYTTAMSICLSVCLLVCLFVTQWPCAYMSDVAVYLLQSVHYDQSVTVRLYLIRVVPLVPVRWVRLHLYAVLHALLIWIFSSWNETINITLSPSESYACSSGLLVASVNAPNLLSSNKVILWLTGVSWVDDRAADKWCQFWQQTPRWLCGSGRRQTLEQQGLDSRKLVPTDHLQSVIQLLKTLRPVWL